MRKTLCATVLVLALCASTFAGDINNPPIVDPGDISCPPGAPQTSGDQTADGLIGIGTAGPAADGIIHGDNTDSLTTAVLNALASVLPLL